MHAVDRLIIRNAHTTVCTTPHHLSRPLYGPPSPRAGHACALCNRIELIYDNKVIRIYTHTHTYYNIMLIVAFAFQVRVCAAITVIRRTWPCAFRRILFRARTLWACADLGFRRNTRASISPTLRLVRYGKRSLHTAHFKQNRDIPFFAKNNRIYRIVLIRRMFACSNRRRIPI